MSLFKRINREALKKKILVTGKNSYQVVSGAEDITDLLVNLEKYKHDYEIRYDGDEISIGIKDIGCTMRGNKMPFTFYAYIGGTDPKIIEDSDFKRMMDSINNQSISDWSYSLIPEYDSKDEETGRYIELVFEVTWKINFNHLDYDFLKIRQADMRKFNSFAR